MKSLVIVVLFGIAQGTYYPPFPSWSYSQPGPYGFTNDPPCSNVISNEVVFGFRQSVYEVIVTLFHRTVALSDAHFAFSPITIWRALSAIAEGSEGQTKIELYRLLSLPDDRCTRQMYYQLASKVEDLSSDVILERNRLFVADSNVILNRNWENYVRIHKLIDVAQTPFKSNPIQEIQTWRQIFDAQLPNINLNGNSVILESLDYGGLWTSAFPEVSVVKEPFYNAFGKQIANLEYMKMKKRVNVVYLQGRNMKIMELPVGRGGKYRMLFALATGPSLLRHTLEAIKSSVLFEVLANLKKTPVPIDIAIPRISMTSELDVRRVLEDVGVRGMWSDPFATRNISEPAALPSSFIQRVSVTLDNKGVIPSVQEYANFVPSVLFEPYVNATNAVNDFIANRPFSFGLFDSETYVCLFSASFSRPTY